MTRTKLGLMGLCAAVLGLLALNASGAQAEGKWLILVTPGGVVRTGEELPATLELEKDKGPEGLEHYVLHTEILKIKVLFLCTDIKLVNAKIFGAAAIGKGPGEEKESKILFSGCETFLNGVLSPECPPTDPADGKGFIVTKPLHGLAALHELAGGAKDDIIKVLPDEGQTLVVPVFPPACPIGTSVAISGELALQDCEKLALTHLVKHLLSIFEPLTKLWAISNTPEHVVTILGSAWAKLGGIHAGMQWSLSSL